MDRELYNQMYTLGERKREVSAQVEVGHTAISRGTAWLLIVLFALTALAVPVGQYVHGRGTSAPGAHDVFRAVPAAAAAGWHGDALFRRVVNANDAALKAMDEYERGLENDLFLRPHVRPWVQLVTGKWLGASGEQVYVGREGWLFYRPDIDHVTGPGFLTSRHVRKREAGRNEWEDELHLDPVRTIADFAAQLDRRGIRLIVMPTPVKPQIHPERFSARYAGRRGALHNPSFAQFKAELEAKGVLVFDCAEALADAKRPTGSPQYLETDTHWTPQAAELIAAHLKEFIDEHAGLPKAPPTKYTRRDVRVANHGDLAAMLGLPAGQERYGKQEVVLREVMRSRSYLWRPDRDADVLVLGDSFTNIYSLEAMGWGESAGLAEQLSFLMQRPLDRIVRNAGGAFATRQMLGRELARGRDRLAGKKLVIWQFAARELSSGNWRPLDMTLGKPGPSNFVVPAPKKEMTFSGIVNSITPAPRPGTVTYKDHIIAAHLVDLQDEAGKRIAGGQAVVYMWSMRDAAWTPAARFRVGQTITVRAHPWDDVADKYEGINKAELGGSLALEDACWAEEAKE
ncbi:MAG: hypothetical protein ABIF82_15385 [Planctomycetota bacterium]